MLLHIPSAAMGAALGMSIALMVLKLRLSKASASGELWASPLTTCSRRAIAACIEAGIDYHFVPIDLAKGEHKLPAMMKLNPYGKVPAWRDASGFDLYESRAIMRHVAEQSGLVPSTARERALMEQWLWVDEGTFKPPFKIIQYMRVLGKLPLDEDKCAASRVELEATLDTMEAWLASSGLLHLASDAFTLADLTYMCYFELFPACGLQDTLDVRPTLAAWWARCRARPAWKLTLSQEYMAERALEVDPLGRAKPWR